MNRGPGIFVAQHNLKPGANFVEVVRGQVMPEIHPPCFRDHHELFLWDFVCLSKAQFEQKYD